MKNGNGRMKEMQKRIREEVAVIGFDADDTLWVNEPYFRQAETRFVELLSPYPVKEEITGALYRTEIRNLELYGYGIKAFVLSLVECAIDLTGGSVGTDTISDILGIGRDLLTRPIELLEGVKPVLKELAPFYKLIVATKGDLLDQERKMRRSSITSHFHHIEVMSDKREQNYIQLLDHLEIDPCQFLMIGNSMRSDILPPLRLGAWAIHIPFHTTWIHEEVSADPESSQFMRVESLSEIPGLLGLERK